MSCFRAIKSFPIETVCLSEEPFSFGILRRLEDSKETLSRDSEHNGSQVVLIGYRAVSLSLKQGRVYVYDTRANEFCCELSYSDSRATSVGSIASFNNVAAVGYENGEILLWDLDNPSVYFCSLVDSGNRAHLDKVNHLKSALKEYPFIASYSDDGTIKIWNLSRFSCDSNVKTLRSAVFLEKVLPFCPPTVLCWNISHDGNHMVTGSKDGSIHVFDLQSLKEHSVLLGHMAPVIVVSFYLQGTDLILSGSTDETIRLWNYTSGNCVLLLSSIQIPRDFIFIDENLLFICTSPFGGFLWNLFYGQCLAQVILDSSDSLMDNSARKGTDENTEICLSVPQTLLSTWEVIRLDYDDDKYQVFIPTSDCSILTWNCYPLLQKWKEFIPLKEIFRDSRRELASHSPKMACSTKELPVTNNSCLPLDAVNNGTYNRERILHWREQRLNSEQQSIDQQRKELELWSKTLEETKEALEELYKHRAENLERKSKVIDELYRQISLGRSSHGLLAPLYNVVQPKH